MHILKASLMILALFVCGLTAQAQAKSKIKQESTVDFPTLGKLRVQVIESGKSSKVIFKSGTRDKIVNLFSPVKNRPGARWPIFKAAFNEALYFKVGSIAGVPGPLIFISKVYRGADHCGFKTDVVGEVAGRLRLLTNKPFETDDMGGMLAGDLGHQEGQGVAVWSFIWGSDESHFGEHRYRFELHKYDARQNHFVKTKTLNSQQKYSRGEDAAKELRLPSQNFLSACGELFDDSETLHINPKNK